MGRAIERCAPIVLSDANGIHEPVEPSSNYKIPARRTMEPFGDAIVDIRFAWGLDSAFRTATKHLPSAMPVTVLDRYRRLVQSSLGVSILLGGLQRLTPALLPPVPGSGAPSISPGSQRETRLSAA